MEHQDNTLPCTRPMYGELQKRSTTSNGKKSYILTQKVTDYSYYSPIGPLMTDAVAIGYSANYQMPLDAVLCNHPAADLQNLNNGMLFQPDAVSLSEASICSSMETWTTDAHTNISSDAQSTELLAQSHPTANFCYNSGMERYSLNNNNNQFYTEDRNTNATAISQQWDSSSPSISTPYSYYLQQQPNNLDHSNSIWLQGTSSMTIPHSVPYTQTTISNQLQFDSTFSPEPHVADMCLTSSSTNHTISIDDQADMQQEHNAEKAGNHHQDNSRRESCKSNRRHTVSLPYSDASNNNVSDRKRQSVNATKKEEPFSFSHLSREELIQRVVQLEKEKEISKLSAEKQAVGSSILSPDGSDEEDVYTCRWAKCQLTTSTLDQLIEHIRELHVGSGKAAYHCEWASCPRNQKPFMKRHKMQNHMRTHTGERPFVCHIEGCDKRFSRPDSLNTHIKTHSSIRPYLCLIHGCGKAYFHSRSLRKHSKSHNYPYPKAAGSANIHSYQHPHPIEYAQQQYTY